MFNRAKQSGAVSGSSADMPSTDQAFKGADSLALLREATQLVRAKGYAIGNVDSTVIAQAPKLAPHIATMRQNIAQALGIEVDCVNVKAKTAEKMGPVGEGRAMEARAVVLRTYSSTLSMSGRIAAIMVARPAALARLAMISLQERNEGWTGREGGREGWQ